MLIALSDELARASHRTAGKVQLVALNLDGECRLSIICSAVRLPGVDLSDIEQPGDKAATAGVVSALLKQAASSLASLSLAREPALSALSDDS